MDFNKKRIFIVVIISIILVTSFILLNFTHSIIIIKGEKNVSWVGENDTEFDLENDAFLRNKPNFSSKTIGTIKAGTHVQVLKELNKWVKITDGTNEGWVVKQNIVTIETTTQPENNIIDNEISNSSNDVTNSTSNNVLNNTNTSNTTNNATSNSSTTNTTSNVGKVGVVNVDTARVREEPDGKMMGLVDLNDKVEILAEEGDWYKANIGEFKNCYIAKRLVTIK